MGFPAVMKQMLRRFGPRGCDARQDVSAAADIGVSSEEETDFEGWAAQRKKKKQGGKENRKEKDPRKSKNKTEGIVRL